MAPQASPPKEPPATPAQTATADSSGQITVAISLTLVAPASLGSGFFASSVTFMVCYDKACQHQLAGSPATEPISYTVFLTEGQEYSLRTVNAGGISDLAYDAVGQRLYVSALSGYQSGFSGAVTQVDPLTGDTGTQISLADDVFGIAEGSFAEYARARANKLAPKPAGLTHQQAAATTISALTALQAAHEQGVDAREQALDHLDLVAELLELVRARQIVRAARLVLGEREVAPCARISAHRGDP
jgi:hypothetical protein